MEVCVDAVAVDAWLFGTQRRSFVEVHVGLFRLCCVDLLLSPLHSGVDLVVLGSRCGQWLSFLLAQLQVLVECKGVDGLCLHLGSVLLLMPTAS